MRGNPNPPTHYMDSEPDCWHDNESIQLQDVSGHEEDSIFLNVECYDCGASGQAVAVPVNELSRRILPAVDSDIHFVTSMDIEDHLRGESDHFEVDILLPDGDIVNMDFEIESEDFW